MTCMALFSIPHLTSHICGLRLFLLEIKILDDIPYFRHPVLYTIEYLRLTANSSHWASAEAIPKICPPCLGYMSRNSGLDFEGSLITKRRSFLWPLVRFNPCMSVAQKMMLNAIFRVDIFEGGINIAMNLIIFAIVELWVIFIIHWNFTLYHEDHFAFCNLRGMVYSTLRPLLVNSVRSIAG